MNDDTQAVKYTHFVRTERGMFLFDCQAAQRSFYHKELAAGRVGAVCGEGEFAIFTRGEYIASELNYLFADAEGDC